MKNILLCLILMSCCSNKSGNGQFGGSFPLTYYTSQTLTEILDLEKCKGIRIYPVIDKGGNPSTMIVGIDASGAELPFTLDRSGPYQMYTGLQDVKPTSTGLNKNQAKERCAAYTQLRDGFVVDFSDDIIKSMLGNIPDGGIVFSYLAEQSGNFEAQAYKVSNDRLEGMGAKKRGEPCPTACGVESNYLCFPGR